MRISFDLDGTLVVPPGGPRERLRPWWRRWRRREPMRLGTRDLMAALALRGCEVWVYTTSHRSPRAVRGWLRGAGAKVAGVVNQDAHDRVVGRGGPSKDPRAFGIDLHVDDLEGVRWEGDRLGFEVLVIAPDDPDWAARVLAAVDERRRRG